MKYDATDICEGCGIEPSMNSARTRDKTLSFKHKTSPKVKYGLLKR